MTRKSWIVLAAGIVLLVAGFTWAFRPQPIPVEVAEVRRARFEQSIEEDGRTRVRARYLISAPIAGRLDRIELDPGDVVTAGKPVARISPSSPGLLDARTMRELEERVGAAEAQLAQAGAESARADALLLQARTDLARNVKLQGEGFIAQTARDQAELAVRVQTRAAEAALAARHAAEHNLAQARAAALRVREVPAGRSNAAALPIISPVSGRVLRVLQQSEGVVAIGTPLLEVANADDLEVVVDVLSSEAIQIPAGARVQVEAGPGNLLDGHVRRVEPAAFTKVSALGVEEQRVNVIIDFDAGAGPARGLGDGYRVDARIIAFARPDATVVPVAALFRRGAEWSAFVLDADRVRLRAVRLGGRNSQEAWVVEGLNPGDRVIVYPSDSVQDGKRVKVVRGREGAAPGRPGTGS